MQVDLETIKSLSVCIYTISVIVSILRFMVYTNKHMKEWDQDEKNKYFFSYLLIMTIGSFVPILNTINAIKWVIELIYDKDATI